MLGWRLLCVGGSEQGGSSGTLPHPSHMLFMSDGCTNCGLMKENPANSAWSMLAITSSSGGVSWGWVRVKNLSKFSAPLPHCRKERQEKEKLDIRYVKITWEVQADRQNRTDTKKLERWQKFVCAWQFCEGKRRSAVFNFLELLTNQPKAQDTHYH